MWASFQSSCHLEEICVFAISFQRQAYPNGCKNRGTNVTYLMWSMLCCGLASAMMPRSSCACLVRLFFGFWAIHSSAKVRMRRILGSTKNDWSCELVHSIDLTFTLWYQLRRYSSLCGSTRLTVRSMSVFGLRKFPSQVRRAWEDLLTVHRFNRGIVVEIPNLNSHLSHWNRSVSFEKRLFRLRSSLESEKHLNEICLPQ